MFSIRVRPEILFCWGWAAWLGVGLMIVWSGGCGGKGRPEAEDYTEPVEVQPISTDPQQAAPEPAGMPVGAVLMEVDQEVVTTADALAGLEAPLTELGQRYQGQQFRVQTEHLLVEYLRGRTAEILLLNEARKGLSEQQSNMVEARKEAYRAQLLRDSFNSQTRLDKRLRQEGKTLEGELERYERELQVRMFLSNEFANRISITRDDLVSYHQQQSQRYNTPKKVELLKIQVLDYKHSEDGASPEQVRQRCRARAQQAWQELGAGRPFSVVAMKYSDVRAEQGGNWGLVNPESLEEDSERRAAQTLEAGEYSKVLDTELGCCVVGVAQVIPAQQKPLEEVQEEIRQALWEKQYNRLYNQRLDELGQRAVISASPLALRMAVDLAEQRFTVGD